MSFKPAAGYGEMFSYNKVNVRADGFEVQHIAGSIMRKAIDELVFTRPLTPSPDAFGKGKGGTFMVPIALDWGMPATVSPLVAGTAISIGTQTTDKYIMTIEEYGTGVGYETFTDWFTNLDFQQESIESMGRHVGRMINWLDYKIAVDSTFAIESPAAGSYSSILGTNRFHTSGLGTTFGEFGPGLLAAIYDGFKNRVVSPITSRGQYLIISNARTLRHLKQGSVFQNLSLYTNQQGLRYQILGEFMGFVFIETEELTGNGTSFAYGKNAGGYGFGKLPTVTYYPDFGQDAGRLQVLKTLFYRGQGPTWRDKGTCLLTIHTNTAAYNYGTLG